MVAPDDNTAGSGAVWTVMDHRVGNRGWMLTVVACGGLALAAARLGRPVTASAFTDSKAAGADLFATRGCAHCHGDDGQGTDRAPTLRGLRKKMSADQVREQIVHGGQGMPAFGDSLKDDEVNELVSFLRAKKWVTPPAVVHSVEGAGSPGSGPK